MSVKSTCVILNPLAHAGKAGRLAARFMVEIEKKFGLDYTFYITRKPHDATFFTREAVRSGAKLIIAVGGDGTANEIINGLYHGQNLINPDCELGIIKCGTGNGLADSIGIPPLIEEQIDLIINTRASGMDLGFVSYVDMFGAKTGRLFVNEFQAGIGAAVVKRVGNRQKILGGTCAFAKAAVAELLSSDSYSVRIQLDDEPPTEGRFIGIVVGNCNCCAGGMKLTPNARPYDGEFDILLINRMNVASRLLSFSKVYSGTHIQSSKFTILRGRKIRLESEDHVMIEADGELLGTLPCEIELLPEKLKVRYKPDKISDNDEKNIENTAKN